MPATVSAMTHAPAAAIQSFRIPPPEVGCFYWAPSRVSPESGRESTLQHARKPKVAVSCRRMRPPPDAEIYAPEFPPKMDWLNVAFLRMNTLMRRGPVLVEFWDFARVNSLRTMPYLKAWHERYSDAGLRVIGVHSPGYSFGRDRDLV